LTGVTSQLLSSVRLYAHILSYGGAHEATSGSFSFFNQSVDRDIDALNFHSTLTKDNNVHVVVYGNFTPAQRHLVKS
jgi:hypothetical protein